MIGTSVERGIKVMHVLGHGTLSLYLLTFVSCSVFTL